MLVVLHDTIYNPKLPYMARQKGISKKLAPLYEMADQLFNALAIVKVEYDPKPPKAPAHQKENDLPLPGAAKQNENKIQVVQGFCPIA